MNLGSISHFKDTYKYLDKPRAFMHSLWTIQIKVLEALKMRGIAICLNAGGNPITSGSVEGSRRKCREEEEG